MFHKITYNSIILARRAIKFLDFLYISKFLALLDYNLKRQARDKIKSIKTWTFWIKRKLLSKNFITLRIKITVL